MILCANELRHRCGRGPASVLGPALAQLLTDRGYPTKMRAPQGSEGALGHMQDEAELRRTVMICRSIYLSTYWSQHQPGWPQKRHRCTVTAVTGIGFVIMHASTHPLLLQDEMRASNANLAFAWMLVALCSVHHAGHVLHALGLHEAARAPLLVALADPWVSGILGTFALLGPGRR